MKQYLMWLVTCLLAVSLGAGCCPALSQSAGEGLTKIAAATDMVAVYAIEGGSFDPAAAGWAEGTWNQEQCVGALQMYEVMVALHEVGVPAIMALAAGEQSEAPPQRETPDYDAQCKEIQDGTRAP